VRAGDVVQRRWLPAGGPFQSNSAPEVHFGVPKASGPLTVTVRFADGEVVTMEGIAAGQRVVVDRAKGATARSR
jgi:hypothetical protein